MSETIDLPIKKQRPKIKYKTKRTKGILVQTKKKPEALLNVSQQKFVTEYLKDCNAQAAAIRAGYESKEAAYNLMKQPLIVSALYIAMGLRSQRTMIESDDVLKQWALLASASTAVNELEQIRRVNCRYCNGPNHEYLHSWEEWVKNETPKHNKSMSKPAQDAVSNIAKGGDHFFDPLGEPNADCPNCHGAGETYVYRPDTRELSPAAQALYAGVETHPDGRVKRVIMRDPTKALEQMARHLGMFIDRKEITGANGDPLEIVVKVVRPTIDIDADDVVEVSDE